MCGKFTAQASWREVHSFSQPLTESSEGGDDSGSQEDDVAYRVTGALPVLIWDAEAGKRRVVPMRWGFPHPKDWRRPQPIHARSETIDIKQPFRTPFNAGQRGIVLFRTFNEGEEVVKPSGRPETRQWTIDPQDGRRRPFAFVWRRYEIEGQPAPLLFCVMVTVPANDLIRRSSSRRKPSRACRQSSMMRGKAKATTYGRRGWARTARILPPPRRCSRRWQA